MHYSSAVIVLNISLLNSTIQLLEYFNAQRMFKNLKLTYVYILFFKVGDSLRATSYVAQLQIYHTQIHEIYKTVALMKVYLLCHVISHKSSLISISGTLPRRFEVWFNTSFIVRKHVILDLLLTHVALPLPQLSKSSSHLNRSIIQL